MAKTKRKRTRKHRGTQSGSISAKPRGKPRNRAEARARAGQRSAKPKGPQPPTWGGAVLKGLLAAGLFFALFAGIFGRPLGASALTSLFMLVFYIPLSYYVDGFFYRRRLSQEQKQRQAGK